MPYKPAELERQLGHKFGFAKSPVGHKKSRDTWYEITLPGLPKIATRVSRHTTEIGADSDLIGWMADNLHVRRKFFMEMFACKRDREAYYEQVRADPYPPFSVST